MAPSSRAPADLSIILSTRNRCASLVQTLASFRGLEVPLRSELLLVDNGSTDGTWDAVNSYRHPTLEVRRIMEETPGVSYARNRGLSECSGRVVVFTDDDVRVFPGWITSLVRLLLDGGADAVVGGIRLPEHLAKAWMTPLHRSLFASTELLDPERPAHLISANMAVVRTVLSKVPGFDVELDPGRLGAWGDSLFSWQVREAGFRLRGAFDFAIEHHFDETRLSRASLLRAARVQGVCRAYVAHHWHHESRPGSARRLLRRLLDLAKLRMRNRVSAEGVPMAELQLIESIWLERQWMHESRRPRNYTRRGLTRITR